MTNWLLVAAIFATAVAGSAAGVSPVRRFAERFGLLDQPGPRRVKTTPVPRIGGMAIYFGFLLAIGVSLALPVDRFAEEIARITLLVIGGTIVVATMFFDDVIGLRPRTKLAIQVGVALLMVTPRLHDAQAGIVIESFNVPFVGTVELPLAPALLFTVFWIIGMMNALNWSDGLDGLAGSITLIAALILFLHTFFWPRGNPQFTISLLAIALAGAVIGFLPFNWHPSRIIMGDSGAMFLGFALATISIIGGAKIATALLALGVPIVDMAWVIFFRMLHRRSPAMADRGHLHHRLLDAGWTQQQVVAAYASLAGLFGLCGLILPSRELKLGALVALGITVLALVAWLASRPRSVPGRVDEVA